MLPKSTTIFALDVNCPGDSLSKAVELCMRCAEDKMIFAPHDEIGLVLAGTAESRNPLHESSAGARYQHISVPCGIAPPRAEFIEPLRHISPVREPHNADFLETLTVCAHLLQERNAKRQRPSVVYLLTDARVEAACKEDIAPLLESLQRDAVSVVVIGVDFAEAGPESGWAELSVKAQNELVLRFICRSLGNGSLVVSLDEAFAGLSQPQRRKVAQRPLLKVVLSVGDIRIATQLFTKTQEERLPALKRVTASGAEVLTRATYVGLDGDANDAGDSSAVAAGNGNASAIDNGVDRTDANVDVKELYARFGGCELERRHLIRAYRYGQDLIPCTDADVASMRIPGSRALDAIAFVPIAELPVYVLMGGVRALLPLDDDAAGTRAFRSIVRAMAEAEKAMIVRFVRTRDAKPVLGACFPSVKERRDTLFFAPLPFAEDVRLFRFSAFAGIQFTDEETALMDKAVADLTVGEDVLRPRDSFSPVLRQYYAALRARLRAPQAPPPPDPRGASGERKGPRGGPLEAVMARARSSLEACAAAFPFAPAEARAAERPLWFRGAPAAARGETESERFSASPAPSTVPAETRRDHSPSSAGTIGTVAAGGFAANACRVTTVDPLGTFRAMMESPNAALTERAADELVEVVFKLLRYSIADAQYAKCADCVDALREHCVAADKPAFFNSFLVKLMLMARELDRADFWESGVISRGVRPITRCECGSSTVEDGSAAEYFLSQDRSFAQPVLVEDDGDDILAMIR